MNEPKNNAKTGNITNSQVAVGDNINQGNNNAPATDSKPENINDLLVKLKKAIEQDTELNKEQREIALSKLQILTEASQHPNNETTKLEAVGAKEILKRIISGLSPVSALFNIGKTVLPAIAKWLEI